MPEPTALLSRSGGMSQIKSTLVTPAPARTTRPSASPEPDPALARVHPDRGAAEGTEPIQVALRSDDPRLIEQVRKLTNALDLPLTSYRPGARPPRADVVLDSAWEWEPDDVEWRRAGRIFAWVGLDQHPDRPRMHVLPEGQRTLQHQIGWLLTARRATVIGIVGARGGVGATCAALTLAREFAARGESVIFIDCSADGASLDYITTDSSGLGWSDLTIEMADDPEILIRGLPVWRQVRVLSDGEGSGFADHPHGRDLLNAMTATSRRIIVDLGPQTTAAELASWCDHLGVVTTADQRGIAGLTYLARRIAERHMFVICRSQPGDVLSPAEVLEAAGPAPIMTMAHERSLRASLERGLEPGDQRRGPLRRCARELADLLESGQR